MPGERVHVLMDEGEVAVRLDYKHLPDLDDLMLRIAEYVDDEDGGWRYEEDEPTAFRYGGEPVWEWAKTSPCWCGEHGWHWDARRVPDDLDLLEDRPKGRFIAMQWR